MRKCSSSDEASENYPILRADSSLTDSILLESVAEGRGDRREAAFSLLISRHGPRLRKVCRGLVDNPHDVEDLTQTTFLVLLRKAGTIRDAEALGSWLQGVARKLAVPIRTSRSRFGSPVSENDSSSNEPSASELAESSEVIPIVRAEIDLLPYPYRDPVILCCLEGRSNEEAAATLCVPVGTVKGRLSRARGLLKERLGRRGLEVGAILSVIFGSRSTLAASVNGFATAARDVVKPAMIRESRPSKLMASSPHSRDWMRFARVALILIGMSIFGTTVAVASGAIPWPFTRAQSPQKNRETIVGEPVPVDARILLEECDDRLHR